MVEEKRVLRDQRDIDLKVLNKYIVFKIECLYITFFVIDGLVGWLISWL